MSMKKIFSRAIEILKEDGVGTFTVKSISHINGKIDNKLSELEFIIFGKETESICSFDKEVNIYTDTYEEYSRVHEYKNTSNSKEKDIVDTIMTRIEEGDVFYDIGANIGIYSCIIGKNRPDIEIIAFEPYPPNIESIKLNSSLNDIELNIQPIALSECSGQTDLQIVGTNERGSQEHTLLEVPYHQDTHLQKDIISVKKESGDKLIRNGKLPKPNILKIDVEGAGPSVIRGLSESLADGKVHTITIEAHNNKPEIRTQLQSLGFNLDEQTEFICGYKAK